MRKLHIINREIEMDKETTVNEKPHSESNEAYLD